MMQRKFDLELAVGIFVLIGILSLGYLSIRLGKLEVVGTGGYTVYAEFTNAGGIKSGSVIEIAGVEIGKVKNISLDLNNYSARADFLIYKDIKIQEDAIASIKTKGLIGEKFIQITPGGSDTYLSAGGKIRETESAIDIEELVSKYVFGKV
ncbi:MAG TPA: outer membrane lipid asymmetry maintenance protein MlaD [Dissulfurispiraceae bacterium]|nr:outer membrane lipid asymmetry maintenance protein MlaD [Dissulfurispiraceae bacterium]